MHTPHNLYLIIGGIIVAIILIGFIAKISKRRAKSADSAANVVSSQIYVGNLAYSIKDFQLKKIFSEYGNIQSARIIKNPQTRRSKGFAFVTFSTPKEAKKALKSHGVELQGRALVVRIAKPR